MGQTTTPRTITVNTAEGRKTFTVLFPDLLRPLTADERAGLKVDIRTRGIIAPVVVDEDDGVIDGINRLEIAAELGDRITVPVQVQFGLTADCKRELALALNEHRRQLSQEELRQLRAQRVQRVAAARESGKSIRTIAEEEKVSVPQVQRDLKQAGVSGDTPRPTADADSSAQPAARPPRKKVKGRDGKTYPAGKKAKGKPASDIFGAVPALNRLVDAGQVDRSSAQLLAALPRSEQRELLKGTPAAVKVVAVKAKAADLYWLQTLPRIYRLCDPVPCRTGRNEPFDPTADVSPAARLEALKTLKNAQEELRKAQATIADWIACLEEKVQAHDQEAGDHDQ